MARVALLTSFKPVCRAELLYGAKDGVFQYDKLIALQSKTADGLVTPLPSSRPHRNHRITLPCAAHLHGIATAERARRH